MTINPKKDPRHHWFSSLWILLIVSMAGCMSTGEAKGPAAIPLTDIEWRWVEAVEQEAGQITTVSNPEKYTLVFRTDGTFHGKADCNLIGGSYVNSEGFKITLGPSTMAYCGEQSLDKKYLAGLGLVRPAGWTAADNLRSNQPGAASV